MRLQSKKTLAIRDKILGGSTPLICLPLVAIDPTSLIQQAKDILVSKPDVLEWRVDKFHAVRDPEAVLHAMRSLRETIGNIPLIFTCRVIHEGGFQEIDPNDRLALIEKIAASGLADLIDTEISNDEIMIETAKNVCLRTGAKLILSYHNFEETPDEDFIVEKLMVAKKLGADVAKVAVMPKNYKDVLTLLSATLRARTELLDIPIITMSMGGEGAITRIAGGLFGSDLTFAIGQASSAPGQIPIGDLRKAWEALPFD